MPISTLLRRASKMIDAWHQGSGNDSRCLSGRIVPAMGGGVRTRGVWCAQILVLCIGLSAQSSTAAANDEAVPPDRQLTCPPDAESRPPGYWQFGPDGSWSGQLVLCPLAKSTEAAGWGISTHKRTHRESVLAPETDISRMPIQV